VCLHQGIFFGIVLHKSVVDEIISVINSLLVGEKEVVPFLQSELFTEKKYD
jgi:hypothetical protein